AGETDSSGSVRGTGGSFREITSAAGQASRFLTNESAMSEVAETTGRAESPSTPGLPRDRGTAEEFSRAHLTHARMVSTLGGLALLALGSMLVAAAFGSVHVSLVKAISDSRSPDHAIFMSARLPRVLMGAAVGAVLAAVGAALQALVRNPLAEGGILGISGG